MNTSPLPSSQADPLRSPRRKRFFVGLLMHGLRIAGFVAVVLLIHLQARKQTAGEMADLSASVPLEEVRSLLPAARAWGESEPQPRAMADPAGRNSWWSLRKRRPASDPPPPRALLDSGGRTIGSAVQTSPHADHVVGFSGPTNVLVVFDPEQRVLGLRVLWSRDTREHLQAVLDDPVFLDSFRGLSWDAAAEQAGVDSVSGATLTSMAIAQSVAHRLGGEAPSLKFPDPLKLDEIRPFFPGADRLVPVEGTPPLREVRNARGEPLGRVLRTSPAADNLLGYQGPTETLLALGPEGRVLRMHVRRSYDNDPYVGYLNQDWSFPELFEGLTLPEVAGFDLETNQIEGVSGATMTSMAVAEGVIRAADAAREPAPGSTASPPAPLRPAPADYGTFAVLLAGIAIALTRLRGIAAVRIPFQLLLIGYVGVVNGDLLSQAMFVGWARSGIPWQSSLRLVLLAGAALTLPVISRRNVYCTHLCPHGAVQQLLKGRVRKQFHPGRRTQRVLGAIPFLLLIWVVLVALGDLPFSLVDIEPFDAYLFRIAGWATITVAVVGIIVSLFVPMGYCRFGCPTGALLGYLRRHGRSDELTRRDLCSAILVVLAVAFFVLT